MVTESSNEPYRFTNAQLQAAASSVTPFIFEGVGKSDLGRSVIADISIPGSTSSEVTPEMIDGLAMSLGVPTGNLLVELSPVGAGDTNSGGLPLSTCTSGFAVRNSAGTRGILTAGHCGNSQSCGSVYGIHKGGSTSFSVFTSGNYFGSLGVAIVYG